jgi:hypothetical protein
MSEPIERASLEFVHNAEMRDLARPATIIVSHICAEMNRDIAVLRDAWTASQWSVNLTVTRMRILSDRIGSRIDLLGRTGFIHMDSYAALHGEAKEAHSAALARRANALARGKVTA